MAIGKNLLKEKTNVGVKASVTFNAPGNYVAPYGKTVVRIGGRGASGNAGNPGNPGNNTVPGNFVPGNYVPGPGIRQITITNTYSPASGFSKPFSTTYPCCSTQPFYQFNGLNCYGQQWWQTVNASINYSLCSFTNPPSTNPTVPGTAGNIGSAGNAGSNATIGGISFPAGSGGNAGAAGNIGSPGGAGGPAGTAPTVSPTATVLEYNPSGFSVTVPAGGYVDIDNI